MNIASGTRARLITGLVLFLVLGAGVILGVALDRQLEARGIAGEELGPPEGPAGVEQRRRGFDPRGRDPSRPPPEDRDSTQRRPSFFDLVGLTEDQSAKVDSLIVHYRGLTRALHVELEETYDTRFRELSRMAREEIRAVMTEAQLVVYDSIRAEWERRREERRQDSVSGSPEGSGDPRR